MATPVWIDGPLEGQTYAVTDDVIEGGMFRFSEQTIYTFTLIMIFDRKVVVGSVRTGLIDMGTLFAALITPAGQRAVMP